MDDETIPSSEYLIKEKPSRDKMTDEQVMMHLQHYDDNGYEDLPIWLRCEIVSRRLVIPPRPPTAIEMHETETDAFEHRCMHHENTLDDFLAHFKGKRKIR